MSFNVFNRHHSPSAVDMAAKTSSAAKAAVNTLDKGARSVGTSLKRGLRSAVKNFNPAKLSAKVSPFDPDSVKHAKDYGSGAVHAQEQQAAQRMKQQRPLSPQQAHAQRIEQERKQYAARWDREHPAALRPEPRPQTRPEPRAEARPEPRAQPRPAPKPAPQAPAPWQPGHREQFATSLRLERPTAEQTRLANLPIDYDTPEDDVRLIEQAKQQVQAIDERNHARRAKHAQEPWKPTWDPSIARNDTNTLRQRDRFERVLGQHDHDGLSSSERKQLMQEQKHARAGLDKLTNTQAAHNASMERFERQSNLLRERDRIDSRLAKLDPGHPDFDWVSMDRAPEQRAMLAKQRARITGQLKDIGYTDED